MKALEDTVGKLDGRLLQERRENHGLECEVNDLKQAMQKMDYTVSLEVEKMQRQFGDLVAKLNALKQEKHLPASIKVPSEEVRAVKCKLGHYMLRVGAHMKHKGSTSCRKCGVEGLKGGFKHCRVCNYSLCDEC